MPAHRSPALLASPPLSPVSSSSSPASPHRRSPPLARRLLIPSSLAPQPDGLPDSLPRTPRKSTSTRFARARAESGASAASQPLQRHPQPQWPFSEFKLQVVQNDITLVGYRLFAVEKWILERARNFMLIAYTGDSNDKIPVAAVSPHPSLTADEQNKQWDNLATILRREGAKPRQTDHGIILVTLLSSFRSDYTVVHIPDGDFGKNRDQLYANINLLRIGCSGRNALTLNPPSDSTRERFVNTYHFKETVRNPDLFVPTVLELGKVIQCSLSFFGCFPLLFEDQDGLLCDATVAGIDQWVDHVSWPYAKIENSERIIDPPIVAALLSLVLTMRNKLSAVGFSQVPKDPFVQPRQFMRIISAFASQRARQLRPQDSTGSTSTSPPNPLTSPYSSAAPLSPLVLTDALLKRLDTVYEKVRSSESYKVHRVILNKLDDITTATTSAFASSGGRGRGGREHAPSLSLTSLASAVTGTSLDGVMDLTVDLGTFVTKIGLLRGKDGAPSLRYLWAGRFDQLDRVRAEAAWSDVERDEVRERSGERSDGRSSEEDGEGIGSLPWSGRVHRKLEGWKEYAKTKARRSSIDISRDKSFQTTGHHLTQGLSLPSVVVSKDPDELASPSSGQISPISPSASMIALGGGGGSPQASTSAIDDAEFFRRLQYFNQRFPQPPISPLVQAVRARARARAGSYAGLMSWSDPVSVDDLVHSANMNTIGATGADANGNHPYRIGYGYAMLRGPYGNGYGYAAGDETARQRCFPRAAGGGGVRGRAKDLSTDESEQEDTWVSRTRARTRYESASRLKRWNSFDDHISRDQDDCLTPSQMQIDVDLCAQCLIMRRRRFHVDATIKILQTVLQTAAASNEVLKSELEANRAAVMALDAQCTQLTADIDRARYETDAITLETKALRYEAGGYDVSELWQMAQTPRHRVFAIRERVFGTGFAPSSPRNSAKKRGAHGRFNRVQKTLDRGERYVDWLGRTESELDEESELPEVMPMSVDATTSLLSLAESDTTMPPTPGVNAGMGMQGYVGGYAALGELPRRLSAGGGGWLLTLFSKWGSVLGVGAGAAASPATASGNSQQNGDTNGKPDGEAAVKVMLMEEERKEEDDEVGEVEDEKDDESSTLSMSKSPDLSRPGLSIAKKLETIAEENSSDLLHRSSSSSTPVP